MTFMFRKYKIGVPGLQTKYMALRAAEVACLSMQVRCKRHGFDPWVWKIPWRRAQQPTSVFLPGEFHKQGSLVGCNPQSHKELDTSKLLSMRAGPKQERSLISFAKELVPGRGKIWRQSITSLKN